jgi:hypothetical protein
VGIIDFFKTNFARGRSKHQVHVRKAKRLRKGRVAVTNSQPASSKFEKYFVKAKNRGPRGY